MLFWVLNSLYPEASLVLQLRWHLWGLYQHSVRTLLYGRSECGDYSVHTSPVILAQAGGFHPTHMHLVFSSWIKGIPIEVSGGISPWSAPLSDPSMKISETSTSPNYHLCLFNSLRLSYFTWEAHSRTTFCKVLPGREPSQSQESPFSLPFLRDQSPVLSIF